MRVTYLVFPRGHLDPHCFWCLELLVGLHQLLVHRFLIPHLELSGGVSVDAFAWLNSLPSPQELLGVYRSALRPHHSMRSSFFD